MRSQPCLSLVFLFVLVLSVALPPASAEDEVDPAKALLAQLTALRKAGDVEPLATAVAAVPELYKASGDKSLKGKLRGELGKVVKDDDMGAARLVAVDALVALEDPKAAWKELGKALPGPKVKEATELQIAVVQAAGQLAQSRAMKPLLELATKAKDANVATTAAEALGGYGDNKRVRLTVLEELISIGRRTRPGTSTEKATSPESRERWAKVEPGVVNGLNRLTGRSESSFADWESLWDDYKKRPKELFID